MDNSLINKELVSYFIEFLNTNSDKQKSTIENIQRDLNYFLEFLLSNGDLGISAKSITDFIMHLEDNYAESSFIVKASSLRQFINWLNLEENPFWNIKLNISYNDFKYYSSDEISSKLTQDFVNEFDYSSLLIKTIYELYLSIDELVALNLEDYNKAQGKIKARNITLQISPELQEALKIYLKSFRQELLSGNELNGLKDPLFVSRKHFAERITNIELAEVLQELSLRNSQLKRSRIINLLNEGKLPDEIEEILGIKLSNFYQPFVKDRDYRLLTAYKQFHPRASASS